MKNKQVFFSPGPQEIKTQLLNSKDGSKKTGELQKCQGQYINIELLVSYIYLLEREPAHMGMSTPTTIW